ncbi:MAG: diguanylate cyclase [Candidatus Subteraquimicrobiales bacterium]|nr:diguanylate cyclase [Candidatus Subteraquimicrobiales bacterium]
MKYKTFEKLILIFGIGAILATIVISLASGKIFPEELFAQILLIPVLFSAVHYGRSGGLITAIIASIVYVFLRVPVLFKFPPSAIHLISARVLVYLLIGFGGGEICSHIKYFFLKLEDQSSIDAETSLYNAKHFTELIKNYANQFERYEAPFSILIIDLNPEVFSELNQQQQQKSLHAVGRILKTSVRAVDEVGRTKDIQFGLLLPHTEKNGAETASRRLNEILNNYLTKQTQKEGNLFNVAILSYPENKEKIVGLAERA